MKTKTIIFCTFITMIATALVFLMGFLDETNEDAMLVYQVYLDGKNIAAIASEDELYDLINQEQTTIKEEYDVSNVYPPNGFEISKDVTYGDNVSDVKDVYEQIKDEKSFTLKGYTITIKYDDDQKQDLEINVLDEEVFTQALNNLITSFIDEDDYEDYLNDTQSQIVDTGSIIESVYFEETITTKQAYISTDSKIFTDVDELSQYLLFGTTDPSQTYTVQQGDTIEDIAYDHQLNTQEFLIANPTLKSEDSLLSIGQVVNISLISPVVTLSYELHVVEDVDIDYETEITYDDTQLTTYSEITQEGIKGINRVTEKIKYSNGETNEGAVIVSYTTIKEAQAEKVIKGSKKTYSSGTTGTYVDTGTSWAWPTNSPYTLTSPYGYRWGTLHDGMDISGTGYGSPIYASLDGVVVNAGYGGMVGSSAGYNVVIKHSNGYYTVYAHLSAVYVSVGDSVSRRQKIGAMGQSGTATGTHLHFGVFYGEPYGGGYSINPMSLWQ